MEVIAYKGRRISFFVDEILSSLLQLYSNQLVISETSRSNQMMIAILNRLMLSDQEDGY